MVKQLKVIENILQNLRSWTPYDPWFHTFIPYTLSQRGPTPIFQWKLQFWRASKVSIYLFFCFCFGVMGQSKCLIINNNNNLNLGGTPQSQWVSTLEQYEFPYVMWFVVFFFFFEGMITDTPILGGLSMQALGKLVRTHGLLGHKTCR
jgi:hypothetical protein